jgi:Putative adhesin
MRASLSLSHYLAVSALALVPSVLIAQSSNNWEKSYHVGSSAALSLTIDDAGAQVHSCGDCQEVRIHVESNDLSRFVIEEHQEGQHIFFTLKSRPHIGLFSIGPNRTEVKIETPAKLDVDGKSANGAIAVDGTTGTVHLRTNDGSIALDHVTGSLDLTSSNGSLAIHRSSGSLDVRTSDGSVQADGRFDTIQLHSDNGSVQLDLDPSTRLTGPSTIETADGSVIVRVPHDLAAALSMSSHDGSVICDLPLMTQSYSTHHGPSSHLEGTLNGGSVPLSLRASNGNIVLKSL